MKRVTPCRKHFYRVDHSAQQRHMDDARQPSFKAMPLPLFYVWFKCESCTVVKLIFRADLMGLNLLGKHKSGIRDALDQRYPVQEEVLS